MPSNHPIPTIAQLALSLYASGKRVERLPTITEYLPTERVEIVETLDGAGFVSLGNLDRHICVFNAEYHNLGGAL